MITNLETGESRVCIVDTKCVTHTYPKESKPLRVSGGIQAKVTIYKCQPNTEKP